MPTTTTPLAGDSIFEHFQMPSLLLSLFMLAALRASYVLMKKYLEYRVRQKSP